MTRRILRLLVGVVMVAGVMSGAMSSASARERQSGTWVGMVEPHGSHYDYVGRACPVEADFCIAMVVRYRIVPVTRQAAQALPGVAGGTASLEGSLVTRGDRQHNGTLFVERVVPAPPPSPT
ncbi:MAG TPA: hypothetical protein VM942_10520 [Acidimicrobiales bacterium]|nr:hypothetical protein [Acidimicrobiales bacterium]